MTIGSKIKRKFKTIGSKIQDSYNRVGGKKALISGSLSLLGAAGAGLLSNAINDNIFKPIIERDNQRTAEFVDDALDYAFDGRPPQWWS